MLNTVQAMYGVATEREQHRSLHSAVTVTRQPTGRPEGTRHKDNLAECYPDHGSQSTNEITH